MNHRGEPGVVFVILDRVDHSRYSATSGQNVQDAALRRVCATVDCVSMSLELFHPVVNAWFRSRFTEPTEPQVQGWPPIAAGRDILIAAPTGSGKTLTGCQENVVGDIELPDHPLVRQTMHDCLHEAHDIEALKEVLA